MRACSPLVGSFHLPTPCFARLLLLLPPPPPLAPTAICCARPPYGWPAVASRALAGGCMNSMGAARSASAARCCRLLSTFKFTSDDCVVCVGCVCGVCVRGVRAGCVGVGLRVRRRG